ncbi:unnamed protein product [Boreogadus saida]
MPWVTVVRARNDGSCFQCIPNADELGPDSLAGSPEAPVGELLRQSGTSGGGSFGGTPAAQLPECNSFLLAVQFGLQRLKAKVPFPQFFSTMAEINPTTSLYEYQRRHSQS